MIECENDLNNYQVVFYDSFLNQLNSSIITEDKLLCMLFNLHDSIGDLSIEYQELLKVQPRMKFFIRDLGVNFILEKVICVIARRQIILLILILQYSHALLRAKSNEESILETENFELRLSETYPHNLDKVHKAIVEECSVLMEKGLNSLTKDLEEQQEIHSFIEKYCEREIEFIEGYKFRKVEKRTFYYFFTKMESLVNTSIFRVRFFLSISAFISSFNDKMSEEGMLFDILINCSKLQLLTEIFFGIFGNHLNDLLEDLKSPDWDIIKLNYKLFMVTNRKNVEKSLMYLNKMLIIGSASVADSYDQKSNQLPLLKNGIYAAYYLAHPNKAKHSHNRYTIKYDFDIGKQIWGLIDLNVVKDISKIGFSSIDIRTRNSIPIKKGFSPKELNKLIIDFLTEKGVGNKSVTCLNRKLSNVSNDSKDYIEQHHNIKDHVSLKFLANKGSTSHIPDNYLNNDYNRSLLKKKSSFNDHSKGDLLIHIHGGGFVSMSSTSHENYLRRWCKEANIPVISIDYSLSPEYPYPTALNEIYQSYLWIIEQSEIKCRKIILAGDSAGGNFVMALTCLLIVTKKRMPDLLLLCYPALYVSMNVVNPSLLVSLDDPILSYALLKHCCRSYIKNINPDKHPFTSPGLMPDEILKLLPKTNFYIASTDPLRDQSLIFASRLL